MKNNSYDDDQLETLLSASYDRLRQPVAGQRQAVLDAISPQQAESSPRATSSLPRAGASLSLARRRGLSPRVWRVGTFSLATATCILALVGVRLLAPSATSAVLGVEEVGRRMCEVQTIRMRGWQYFYNDRHPAEPPIRIPVEDLVKRPDKYRSTFYGVSYGEQVVVKSGTQFCDGRLAGTVNDTDKRFNSQAISPIDALLKTENRAQLWVATALRSPPTGYKKTGEGHCHGRKCDLYEGQSDDDSGTRRSKLWLDPTTGYPLRLTEDELQPDGSFRRETEYEEILVNVPLADALFELIAPAGYERFGPAPQESAPPPVLGVAPTSGGNAGGITLDDWNTLRIADNAALVVWRRSAPESAADGTQDWLSNIDWKPLPEKSGLTAEHAWIYNAKSSEAWSWSLVVVTGGRWPDPGNIALSAHAAAGDQVSLGMLAIWFSDHDLRRILAAMTDVMLPADAPRFSLDELRAKAAALSGAKVAL